MSLILGPIGGLQGWKAGLADPEKQWKAGYSAQSAARSWEAAKGLPPEIAALLGADATLQLAIPEHQVPLPGGNRDSQCDVFALVRARGFDITLAVEAEVNEPFGPTLAEWFVDPSDGKRLRLSSICEWLGLPFPPPGHLRYQLFHRTAAAIVEARRFHRPVAAMLVQSFSTDHRWIEDYQAFCTALGVSGEVGRLNQLTLPDGLQIWLGWAQGDTRFLSDLTSTSDSDPDPERSNP